MKNIAMPIVILIIAVFAIMEFRYSFLVSSPVVAKFDRLTGKAWIVNAGVWRQVQMEPQAQAKNQPTQAPSAKMAGR